MEKLLKFHHFHPAHRHISLISKALRYPELSKMPATLYSITVDTEEEWNWSSGYRTDSCDVSNIRSLEKFQTACDELDAKVTYFVNHAVLANQTTAGIVRNLAEHPNVEIGMHIHSWNTPPLSQKTEVSEKESFLHNIPRDVAIEKLKTVLDVFDENNLKPTSFRGGRYSTCDWMQKFLHQNGIIADASILPFTTWPDEGAPDFRDRGLLPVRRDIQSGKHGLWEIPLTLAYTKKPWTFWRKFYELGEVTPLRQLRMIAIAERLFVKRIWLNLEHPLGEHSTILLQKLQTASLPCINFTLHSSSLVAGLNSYSPTELHVRKLYERLRSCISTINTASDFQTATVTEIANQLEKQHNENSGN